MTKITAETWIPLGAAVAATTVVLAIGAFFTRIDTRTEAQAESIVKLETRIQKLETISSDVAEIKTDVKWLKEDRLRSRK